jgi:hypothetical protein
VSRKEPESSGASATRSSNPDLITSPPALITSAFAAAGATFFFLKFGVPSSSGAKKPAWSANSANAFPDGNLQLIGSIHSMGICGIRMGGVRRPTPLGWLALGGFILFSVYSYYYFGRVGAFH